MSTRILMNRGNGKGNPSMAAGDYGIGDINAREIAKLNPGKSQFWIHNRDRMLRARGAYARLLAGKLVPSAAAGVRRDYAKEFAVIEQEGKP